MCLPGQILRSGLVSASVEECYGRSVPSTEPKGYSDRVAHSSIPYVFTVLNLEETLWLEFLRLWVVHRVARHCPI